VYFNVIRTLLLPAGFIFIALSFFHTGVMGIWWSIAAASWLIATLQFLHMKRKIQRFTPEDLLSEHKKSASEQQS
jgi:uncharacterized membrane protein